MIWPGHARYARLIPLHFEGALSPRQERAMRRHLPRCPGCRGLYLGLAAAEGDGAAAAARRHERLRAGLFGPKAQAEAPRAPWHRLAWAAAAACLAALLTVVILSRQAAPPGERALPGGWQEKGTTAGDRVAVLSRHVSVSVFRPRPAGGYDPIVGRQISRGQPLAFSYTNQAPEGLDRLLLFGVDEGQEVYWFYPAWTDPARSPAAVPIQRGTRVRLPQQVSHDYSRKRLRIFALFSRRRDLTVRTVEATVKGLVARDVAVVELERFPLAKAGQHSLLLEIVDAP